MNKIKNILIVGGTHGNELTGVFLVRKWLKNPSALKRNNLSIDFLLGNTEAIHQNRRYIDKDLNRCFSSAVLNDKTLSGVEIERAHQLVSQLGGKGECKYDLIIDLHTSTAKMDVNLVLTKHDKFHFQMMHYMSQQRDDVVVTSEAEMIPDHHFLCALAPNNLIVEVGPVAQGLLHHETIEKTEATVHQLLDFVEQWNSGSIAEQGNVEVLEYTGKLYYPTDEKGNICAVIHKELQGRDYATLTKGNKLFYTDAGEDIHYEGEECLVSFVNEAAYYDQAIALCTLKKRNYPLEDFLE